MTAETEHCSQKKRVAAFAAAAASAAISEAIAKTSPAAHSRLLVGAMHTDCLSESPCLRGAGTSATSAGTRFDASNTMYRDRYWKPSFFAALDAVSATCKEAGVPVAAASLRWLMHHSALKGNPPLPCRHTCNL